MKTLHYSQPNNLAKLYDEILAAGVALPLTETGCSPVQGSGDDIWLTVPDGADEAAIAAVVAAHDPSPRVVADPDAELEAAIAAATTLAGLKAALLGKTRAGRVKGQARA